jgi:hypothetical protein
MVRNTTGVGNTATGTGALDLNRTGSYNTAIGYNANVYANNLENTTVIGNGATATRSNQIVLGNASIDTVFTYGKLKLGDITYPNTTGIYGYILTTDGNGTASWASNNGVTTVGPISATATATGAYIASNTLYLAPADADNAGIVSTVTQTIAGAKTFTDKIKIGAVTYPNTDGTANQVLTTDGAGNATWAASTSITEVSDEFTATAAQTSFTITHAKGTNRTIKMYINGIRISNTAYSDSSTTVSYNSANNGGYTIVAGDRIQFDYSY